MSFPPHIPANAHTASATQTKRAAHLQLPEVLVDVLHVVAAELRVLPVLVIYILNLAEQSIRESLAEVLFLHGDILRGRRRILLQQGRLELLCCWRAYPCIPHTVYTELAYFLSPASVCVSS